MSRRKFQVNLMQFEVFTAMKIWRTMLPLIFHLKMEAARSSEMMLPYHSITPCHNPQDRDLFQVEVKTPNTATILSQAYFI